MAIENPPCPATLQVDNKQRPTGAGVRQKAEAAVRRKADIVDVAALGSDVFTERNDLDDLVVGEVYLHELGRTFDDSRNCRGAWIEDPKMAMSVGHYALHANEVVSWRKITVIAPGVPGRVRISGQLVIRS